LFVEQVIEDCVADEGLQIQARVSTIDNFKFPFTDAFTNKVIDRMDQNTDIFKRIMDNGDFSALVSNFILKQVYQRLTVSVE
jgi:type I restriction enzyme R subunit